MSGLSALSPQVSTPLILVFTWLSEGVPGISSPSSSARSRQGVSKNGHYLFLVPLGFFDTPVSHMSGAVSRLGLNLAEGHVEGSFGSLLVILGFVLGAMLAGVFVGATHLLPSRRFGVVLMVEGVLLFLAAVLLLRKAPGGPFLAAAACGLQNAMSSSYCGLMIRTTHISGVVTDLGVMLGHWLRHRRIALWKLRFLLALLFSFGGGGFVGASLDLIYGPVCLLLPAATCFAGGTIFFAILHRQKGIDEDNDETLPRTSIFPND
ncbi:MAG: YoaK family protein [Armatimonadota bacterium]